MNSAGAVDARQHLAGLVGQSIPTLGQKKPNRVIAIDGDEVIVGTERSPKGEPVPIEWVQDALDRLYRDGQVLISVKSLGHRRSAFVGAVLGTVPGVEIDERPLRVSLPPVGPTNAR